MLSIGITQFPSTLNPIIDQMLAREYVLGAVRREAREARGKENNVIIYGIGESSGPTEADRKRDDEKSVLSIFERIDADADRIRNTAFVRDVEFYTFLKKLEEYQRILGDNLTILLLSTHRELFELLFQPPKPGGDTKEAPKKKD